jgi:hemoglobin
MKTPTTTLAAIMTVLAISLPAHAQKADDSLYRDMGGLEVLTRVVDDTLALALADVRIKDTFKETDMKRLAKLITEQFCELSGGPCKYSGDPMKEVHQGLGLSNMQFNALVEDLQAAMDKSGIPSRTQNRLLALLAPMQRTVVTK